MYTKTKEVSNSLLAVSYYPYMCILYCFPKYKDIKTMVNGTKTCFHYETESLFVEHAKLLHTVHTEEASPLGVSNPSQTALFGV